jgi:ABC-type uncharacterized transport system
MAQDPSKKPSFSSLRRWGIFFSVITSIVAMIALVIMLNYLGARYYARLAWSTETRAQLSPQTLGLLKSITNEVKVVVYYDKKDRLYGFITDLLNEYRLTNPKISVRLVDYERDAAAALQIKTAYRLGSAEDKNLIIFECNGRPYIVPGSKLGEDVIEEVPNTKEREFRRKLKAFAGEEFFNSALLNVSSSKPLTACFLESHDEHHAESEKANGYRKFVDILGQSNIRTTVITNTLGTNLVLEDFNLLIIAGPTEIIPRVELEKIRKYLLSGGRLFVLFNKSTWSFNTGLEPILADDWGIQVGYNIVKDPENSTGGESGQDVVVRDFNKTHEMVNRLVNLDVQMISPRSVAKLNTSKESPEAPTVEELAFTGEHAEIHDALSNDDVFKLAGRKVSLIAAVEKGSVKGVFPERGTTRIVVAGDSVFLDNQVIDAGENRDFARYAVHWLLDQTQLMQGIGPRPVTEYKLMMTRAQMASVRWIFLAGMPGAILALGGLVWLRRRH